MKKVLSAVLALAMVFSLSCTAFAVEEVPYEPVATEETLSLIHISEPTRPY